MKLRPWLAVLVYLVLTVAALGAIVPFAWMVLTSLKPERELTALSPIPSHVNWGNYAEVSTAAPYFDRRRNSLFER